MTLGRGEHECSPWLSIPFADFARELLDFAERPDSRPAIIAVDGRSSSGKTNLAGRLNRAVPASQVVHTDDIAWFHSRFGWTDLMVNNVLEPLHEGCAVAFRPPAWKDRARPGSIVVPIDTSLVIVEGVGASRADVGHLFDATVWIQADLRDVESRNADRVRSVKRTSPESVHGWPRSSLSWRGIDRGCVLPMSSRVATSSPMTLTTRS
jgi:hypothetical protein